MNCPIARWKSVILEVLIKLLISTAILLPSRSAASSFSAPRSIKKSTPPTLRNRGSSVIVHPSLTRAVLTTSWNKSYAIIHHFLCFSRDFRARSHDRASLLAIVSISMGRGNRFQDIPYAHFLVQFAKPYQN